MLLGETGREREAEAEFRAAAKADPQNPQAAYNLCVLLSGDRPDKALSWCRKAAVLRPEDPRYAYTYAYYLDRTGDTAGAIPFLRGVVDRNRPYGSAYALLGAIYERQGKADEARKVYRKAADNAGISGPDRGWFREKALSAGE
jgi:Flp pilus assembly protein TadD